uniref:Uncharacterized protein n=1 Tax=Macaca nemestrina TaxID=9545 RepID=A0A2K6C0C1_MACNE
MFSCCIPTSQGCSFRNGRRAFSDDADEGLSLTPDACGPLLPQGSLTSPEIPSGLHLHVVLVQEEIREPIRAQAHAPAPCAERDELPAPAVEPEAPLETALQLEAPSGLCTGTAKDQPSEELPDLRPPAVATGLSPGADSVAGDRERVASTTLDSSSHTAPSPGHGGSHGVRDQGMQPRLIYLTGKRLILFTRATSQVQQDLCILVSLVFYEKRVPAAPPAPRGGLLLRAWRSLCYWASGLFAPDVLPRMG